MKENYEFNANELYEDSYQNAERMLEDPGKIDRLLKRLEKNFGRFPV